MTDSGLHLNSNFVTVMFKMVFGKLNRRLLHRMNVQCHSLSAY